MFLPIRKGFLKKLKNELQPDTLGVKIKGVSQTRNGDVRIQVGDIDEDRSKLWHRGQGPGSHNNDDPNEVEGNREQALRENDRQGQFQHHEEGLQRVSEGLRGVTGGADGETALHRTTQGGLAVL